jgi:hypothetical protein
LLKEKRMPSSCCGRPIATIINVGNFEAGITGLETALRNVYMTGIVDEEQIKSELLRWVKEFGNYISPGTEEIYKEALLREFKKYSENI